MIVVGQDQLIDALRRIVREAVAEALALEQPVAIPVSLAAKRIGCKRSQIFAYLKGGKLERGEKAGRETMVTVASIERFEAGDAVEHRRRPPKSQPRGPRGRERRLLGVPLDGGVGRGGSPA